MRDVSLLKYDRCYLYFTLHIFSFEVRRSRKVQQMITQYLQTFRGAMEAHLIATDKGWGNYGAC